MARPHIAVIVGSNRRASINRKLAQALVKLGADKFGATFLRIDDLAMFNQDLEANLPAEVVRFKAELTNADGILIVTPEHDRSIHNRPEMLLRQRRANRAARRAGDKGRLAGPAVFSIGARAPIDRVFQHRRYGAIVLWRDDEDAVGVGEFGFETDDLGRQVRFEVLVEHGQVIDAQELTRGHSVEQMQRCASLPQRAGRQF